MTEYVVRFPAYFDDYAAEIEAKGFFADIVVEAGSALYRPLFYDPVRFRQEYEDHLSSGAAAYAEKNIIVVHEVTRTAIDAAVRQLSESDFRQLTPE